ncbi:DUF84 family protein [Halalkalibacter sp. APA_J-10(15)]|uniref:DUF84 family protein n=1 Tax=unclassified Halalkalibacter TaxID=2893063 RepID=UPI001FF4B7FF|nr:DUF84 family protein [Halalkalibacter sp. APA_J-10(15)]MCK0471278.1 DUF84 family protein [Halalkalibacter sp. APA_J-10(15)]
MIVAIGSKNPAKVHAVQATLIQEEIRFIPIAAKSSVDSQPFSDEETILGARNRAKDALLQLSTSTMAFGLEGGVIETRFGLMLCNWGVLLHQDGREWIAGGARIPLPEDISNQLRTGQELGNVMAEYVGDREVRKKQGAIGVFSHGFVDRKEMFSHIVKLLYGQYLLSEKH